MSDDAYGDPKSPVPEPARILRFACGICDQLFDNRHACTQHILNEHSILVGRLYVRPTYRES
jgi:hypothetical protein